MTAMPNMHSEDTLKMGMFQCELMEEFQNDQVWGQLCEYATTMDNAHQISSSFTEKYNGFVQAQDHNGLMGALRADMLDNYIVGAFAAKKMGFNKPGVPMVAWAANNKKDFAGLRGEIGLIRYLIWAGFDVNAPVPGSGATALHLMCNTKWGDGCHPRAIRALLMNGATVDVKATGNGDTALATLSGAILWSDAHQWIASVLLQQGANFRSVSNDGATPLSLMVQNQATHPDPKRAALIAKYQ